jgi:class 3 adenylate cyclase
MGDGVLAYFGYPQAHEHDAERAVHAGLAIVEAAGTTSTYSIRRTSRAGWYVHGDGRPVQD